MKSQRLFCAAGLLLGVAALASTVLANPAGEVVRSGAATFDRSLPGRLIIHQGSDRAIINWRDFSIGQGELTRFVQPGASSVALNRVTSGNLSRIYGRLEANGSLYLINPNGIMVGPHGTINTRTFVGSTLDLTDSSFLAGAKLTLSGDSREPIVNQGSITALGGDVFLVARAVENSGNIRAARGTVGLAAGSEVEIVPAGRERLSVIAGSAAGSPSSAGVNNLGMIEAVAAELKAAGGNIYALAINNGGVIRATGVRTEGGRVYLTSEGGNIDNSGTLSAHQANGGGGSVILNAGHNAANPATITTSGTLKACGQAPGTTGGRVQLTGDHVGLLGAAQVDVSGPAGGGRALIGGGFHGANAAVPNAARTFISDDTSITADALARGNGGRVVIWSEEVTRFYGSISARGGAQGGRGGWVEVSGKSSLDYRGLADLRAPLGQVGSLLLDPKFILIANAGVTPVVPNAFGDDPTGTSTLSPTDLALALNLADVVLQANTDITFNDLVDASGNASVHNLTLQAGRSIFHNADLLLRGSFTATFNDSGALAAQRDPGAAEFTMNNATLTAPGGIIIQGGTLAADSNGATSIGANTGQVQIDALSARGPAAGAGAAGNNGGNISVANNASSGRDITINGSLDSRGSAAAAGPGDLAGGNGGSITVSSSGALTFSSATVNSSGGNGTGTGAGGNAGAVDLTGASSLTSGATIDALGGTGLVNGADGALTLTADNLSLDALINLGSAGALLKPFTAGTLIAVGAGATDLAGAPATLGLSDAELDEITAGTITVGQAAAGKLTVVGAVTQAGKRINLASGGDIAFGNGNSVTSDGVTLSSGGAITSGTGVNVVAPTLSAVAQSGINLDTTITTLTLAIIVGSGDINLTDTAGGLAVGSVNAGAGNVDLRVVGGSLTSAAVDGVADITGNRVTLTVTGSGNDVGGGPLSRLEINAVSVNAFTDGLAGEDISLLDTAGGLAAITVDAGAGNVDLRVANGSLTSGVQDFSPDVAGHTVTLAVTGAGSKIGRDADTRLEIAATTLNASTQGGVGDDIAIRNTSGGVAVGLITAGLGNVDLIAEGGNITSAVVDGTADVVGKVITLGVTGAGSAIGLSAGSRLELNATRVNAATDGAAGDNIFLLDTAGGLAAGSVDAGAGNVDLRVLNGPLTSAVVDGQPDIKGNTITVSVTGAAGEIGGGSGGQRLELNATTLNASSAGGVGNDIFLCDTAGGVAIGLVNGGSAEVDLLVISGNLTSANPLDNVADIVGKTVALNISGARGRIGGPGASALEIDASYLEARTSGNVGQDINITDTSGGLFVTGVDADLASVTLRALGGDLISETIDGTPDVIGAAVNLSATGLGSVGASGSVPIEVNTVALTATAGRSVSVRDTAGGLTVNDITAGESVRVRTVGQLTLGAATVSAGSGHDVVLSAEGPVTKATVVNDGMVINVSGGGRWFIYSTTPAYNTPALRPLGDLFSFGSLVVDRREFGMTLGANPPGSFAPDGLNRLIFSAPERAEPFHEIAKCFTDFIPVEDQRAAKISFNGYHRAKFSQPGDLWLSTADLYDEERKQGAAARATPEKVEPLKFLIQGR